VYPALAIADAVRKRRPDADVVFVGTPERIEARVVPARGYRFETVRVGALSRAFSIDTVLFPFRVAAAVAQSWTILRRVRPAVVVGAGGYVSGPPVLVASCMGIPTLVHEQNSYPGITTRLLARRASEVHLTFERSRRWVRARGPVRVTGNPTRAEIGTKSRVEAARALRLDPSAPTLLVVGGSQGAASLNSAMHDTAPALARAGVQILWATGEQQYRELEQSVRRSIVAGSAQVLILPYIQRMEDAYAVCDLAVTRAGATTLAELSRAAVPSILVPYPFAAADHQTENARAMVEAGAAVFLADADLRSQLTGTVRLLLADRARLLRMADRAREMGTPRAAEELAEAVLRLAESSRG
jgi:UDP-N-acetylglucosamine--N-acetylmuramyl-(pentapeptide) pyrophosphoryl-undecaprenol N-acetylglucosamine transferase